MDGVKEMQVLEAAQAVDVLQVILLKIKKAVIKACNDLHLTDYCNLVVTCKITDFGDVVWCVEFFLTENQYAALCKANKNPALAIFQSEYLQNDFDDLVIDIDFVIIKPYDALNN